MNIKVIEISTPGCSHCAEAKKFLDEEIKPKFPDIEIENISVLEPKGQELVAKYMIFTAPGILINDELFSTGGIDKKAFLAKIQQLTAPVAK